MKNTLGARPWEEEKRTPGNACSQVHNGRKIPIALKFDTINNLFWIMLYLCRTFQKCLYPPTKIFFSAQPWPGVCLQLTRPSSKDLVSVSWRSQMVSGLRKWSKLNTNSQHWLTFSSKFIETVAGTYDSGFDIWGGENLELRQNTIYFLLLFLSCSESD